MDISQLMYHHILYDHMSTVLVDERQPSPSKRIYEIATPAHNTCLAFPVNGKSNILENTGNVSDFLSSYHNVCNTFLSTVQHCPSNFPVPTRINIFSHPVHSFAVFLLSLPCQKSISTICCYMISYRIDLLHLS